MLDRVPVTTAVLYTVVGVLPLYLLAAQAVTMQRALGFGPSHLGIIVSSYFLVSAIAAKRVGPGLDRRGARRGLRVGTALTVVACVGLGTVADRWQLVALLLGVSGLANAYGQVGSNLIVARMVASDRQGLGFSVKQAAIPLSAVVSGAMVPVLGEGGAWRWSFLLVGVLAVALFVVCPSVPTGGESDRPAVADPSTEDDGSVRGARRITPTLLALMVAAAVGGGTGNAMASFTPDAAVAAGFSVPAAALLLTAGSATAIVVRLLAGVAVDRGRGTGLAEMAVLFVAGAAGLALLSLAPSRPGWFVAGLVLTFAGAWGWQGIAAYLALRTVDLPAATSTGAVWSGVYLGTVIVPLVTGWGAERASYSVVFLGMSAAMLLALAILLASGALARREAGARRG